MAAKREFYTTNQVAQTLGISPFTIRRYIHLRKLKAVKLEGSYRVRRTDLEHFLKSREIETEDELSALAALEAGQSSPVAAKKRAKTPADAADEDDGSEPAPSTFKKRTPPAKKKSVRPEKTVARDAEPAAPSPKTKKTSRQPTRKQPTRERTP